MQTTYEIRMYSQENTLCVNPSLFRDITHLNEELMFLYNCYHYRSERIINKLYNAIERKQIKIEMISISKNIDLLKCAINQQASNNIKYNLHFN